MSSIDDEWNNYLMERKYLDADDSSRTTKKVVEEKQERMNNNETVPISEELYISTNTKILYFNQNIDTYDIFWKIPIIEYWQAVEGVVHKNMKIVSTTEEQLEDYKTKLQTIPKDKYLFHETVIKQINISNSKKIKFKDERKIMIGVTKKDIINVRKKEKKAFMNCFSIILRFLYNGLFREIHVKIFNTGNLEIPGVLNMDLLFIVKKMIITILQPFLNNELLYVDKEGKSKSVLINSNFRCGFYIEREKLYYILKTKYKIDASYDPCSYPGVKCKFYFNNEIGYNENIQLGTINNEDRNMTMNELDKNLKYTEITFTLFRTGSCLISGNCNEEILFYIYRFVKQILRDEYYNICSNTDTPPKKEKKNKLKKKIVEMSLEYYKSIS
jgi:hypothetical protein